MNHALNTYGVVPSTEQFGRWVVLSLTGHLLLGAILILLTITSGNQPQFIVAAGGEGGKAIDVGIASESEARQFLALTRVGSLGDRPDQINTERYRQTETGDDDQAEVSLSKLTKNDHEKVKTERPVSSVPARPYSRTEQRGTSSSSSALVGPQLGQLGLRAGIGLGPGGGVGGISGGSDYGRRLQQALIGYYRYAPPTSTAQRFVIVRVTISRTGRIRSVINGRLDSTAFLAKSGSPVVDARAEAALLELDRNPIPFPPDFLPGVREAVADIYFQY